MLVTRTSFMCLGCYLSLHFWGIPTLKGSTVFFVRVLNCATAFAAFAAFAAYAVIILYSVVLRVFACASSIVSLLQWYYFYLD